MNDVYSTAYKQAQCKPVSENDENESDLFEFPIPDLGFHEMMMNPRASHPADVESAGPRPRYDEKLHW